jgi:hypothetical protein
MINRRKYILDYTEASHWYLFPDDKKEEFEQLMQNNPAAIQHIPDWPSVLDKNIYHTIPHGYKTSNSHS